LDSKIPSGYRLVSLDTVGSTNEDARILAEDTDTPAPDRTIIWSREQTGGRGRRGRDWVSPVGNVYCSTILRPNKPADQISLLSFVASLAVHDTAIELLPANDSIRCKWPNDVLVEGQKISGILLETSGVSGGNPDWLVLGVGINVASFPDETSYPATSLLKQGYNGSVESVFEVFIRNLDSRLGQWEGGGFETIRGEWLDRASGQGTEITVNLGNKTLKGVFSDLDKEGALILDQGEIRHRVTAGDVFLNTEPNKDI